MIIVLKRVHNKNKRYYILHLTKNLFSDYLVERVFGNENYVSSTGNIITIFNNKIEAEKYFNFLLQKKLNKGYKIFQKIGIKGML